MKDLFKNLINKLRSKLNNSFVKTYLVLLTGLFLIEIIFKIISKTPVIDFSTVRIFIGLNVVCSFVSFLLNFCGRITKRVYISRHRSASQHGVSCFIKS